MLWLCFWLGLGCAQAPISLDVVIRLWEGPAGTWEHAQACAWSYTVRQKSQPSYAAPSPGPSNNLPEVQGQKSALWTEIGDSWEKNPTLLDTEAKMWQKMYAMLSKFCYFTGINGFYSHIPQPYDIGFYQCSCYHRRKKLFLGHLLLVCSHPTALQTAAASEQGLLACLLSLFCTAPCNQHTQGWHPCPAPRENTGSLLPSCNLHSLIFIL